MGKYKKTVEIDINKKYIFPNIIKTIHHNDKIIVISVETACWIVLENNNQLKFFNLLRKYTIQEAIKHFEGTLIDAQFVIIQIEARKFDSIHVNNPFHQQIQYV